MNQSFSKIWIIVIVVVLLAGGILAWQYGWMGKTSVSTPTPTPEETAGKDESYCEKIEVSEMRANCYVELATQKKDASICWKVETASLASSCWEYFGMKDWKTYKNEEYGFEIKYPENYVVGKTTAKNNQFITFSVDNLQIVIYPTDLSLDDFIKDQAQGYLISNYQKLSFLGQDAYEGVNQGMINSYEIVAQNKGYIYELIFNTNNRDSLVELKDGLTAEQNKMLSTFKFLE